MPKDATRRSERSSGQRRSSSESSGGGRAIDPPTYGVDFVDQNGSAIHEIASAGLRGAASPLPFRGEIQRSFGRHDISRVQAFTDARARIASHAIGAEAYARGSRVAFGRPPSLRTAAHEAAHVVQQRAGVQLLGGIGRSGDKYEQHADEVAECVVQGQSAEALLSRFAPPSTSHVVQTPAVQGAWISRHTESNTLYRYWKRRDNEAENLVSGWYERSDSTGDWGEANVVAGDPNIVSNFPGDDELLRGPVTSHTTRYDANTLVATPLSAEVQNNITAAAQLTSNLSDDLNAKVLEHREPLRAPLKTYRWGQYEYEKDYVVNNGFRLGNVNHGSTAYGLGLYVAKTPWGSAQYATPKDGSIIEVTIPRGTFALRMDKTVTMSEGSGQSRKTITRSVFNRPEEREIYNNPRHPQVALIDENSGWAVIKDDDLDLQIDFYQPNPNEWSKVAPHLQTIPTLTGYVAIQIINRQRGNPIPLPSKEEQLGLYINQPAMKRQKVQEYLKAISQFDFVPFLISNDGLDFNDEFNEFVEALGTSSRYRKHFSYVQPTLQMWAANPFALSSTDFDKVVMTPFTAAQRSYEQDRVDRKNNPPDIGYGLYFSTGAKEKKLTQFRRRLDQFKQFSKTVEDKHSDLAEADKDTHTGIKVGSHHGMLPRGADAESRKEVISETALRGVPQVPTRNKIGIKKKPTAIVMMGLPGSGKSSIIKQVAPDIKNYVVADPDDAKEGLPEYQAGISAGVGDIAATVHGESKSIAKHIVQQSIDTRRNLIYDTTGVGATDEIDNLKKSGYHIKLVYVHVTYETATQRVTARAQQTGRRVPQDQMQNIHYMMRGAVLRLASDANEVFIYNNMPNPPVLAWSGSGSAVTTRRLQTELAKLPQ